MFRKLLLIGYAASAMLLVAQELPVGTALPVMLNSTIDTSKVNPGAPIKARLMQDVDLASGVRIRAGATVMGSILEVDSPRAASGSRVVFQFDRLESRGLTLRFSSHLRALASMTEVFEAQLPTNAIDDYGTSIADWNTVQVGGDAVYRGEGTVVSGSETVGSASVSGATEGLLRSVRATRCHASAKPQALWVFSSTACGLYGYDDLSISHWGTTDPVGKIVLVSKGRLHIQDGSGLLLVTN